MRWNSGIGVELGWGIKAGRDSLVLFACMSRYLGLFRDVRWEEEEEEEEETGEDVPTAGWVVHIEDSCLFGISLFQNTTNLRVSRLFYLANDEKKKEKEGNFFIFG